MKKVLDSELKAAVGKTIADNRKDPAGAVVDLLTEIQDASGLKVCQNINQGDPTVARLG